MEDMEKLHISKRKPQTAVIDLTREDEELGLPPVRTPDLSLNS
jgi:hypothetical protein